LQQDAKQMGGGGQAGKTVHKEGKGFQVKKAGGKELVAQVDPSELRKRGGWDHIAWREKEWGEK